eukprot:TRINITY_DN5634_c0_g1_i2.p1 TRINITY_DN5634_c0_g1~~TRINITY_DN5634_c0_g1_i2.p1  ORF type:complete len:237 (-),score=29.60 TRINITY_DN5634_c0_g1_i2:1636-2346(-)
MTLIGGVYLPMDGRDSQVWSHSTDGSFSVASFFDAFNRDDSNASHISRLWKIKAPPRFLAFTWIALQGGTLAMDNLRHRNMVIVNACPMCLKNAESVDHLFLNCGVVQGLWNDVYSWFDIRGVLPAHFSQLFEIWMLRVRSTGGRILWRTYFLATIWVISQERNNRSFKDKSLAEDRLRDKIKYLTTSWVSHLPSFKGISVDVVLRNWKEVAFSLTTSPLTLQRWCRPHSRFQVKL